MPLGRILREENDAYRERTVSGQSDADRRKQQLTRDSCSDSNAVSRLAVSGNRATMLKPGKRGKCFLKNIVRGPVGEGCDKAYATGFVLETRID